MSYQDTLQHIQETLHIERQLETYPEWIMYAFMVFSGLLLFLFLYSYMSSVLGASYRANKPESTWSIIVHVSGFLAGIVGIIAFIHYIPYTSLTHDSEQRITAYLSQMESDDYTKLKQQVEVNRSEHFNDRTTQSIHEQLVSTLSPRQRSLFFFVRY